MNRGPWYIFMMFPSLVWFGREECFEKTHLVYRNSIAQDVLETSRNTCVSGIELPRYVIV